MRMGRVARMRSIGFSPPRLLAILVIPCLLPKPKILTFTLDSFLGARSNKKENSAESSVTKNGQHQS